MQFRKVLTGAGTLAAIMLISLLAGCSEAAEEEAATETVYVRVAAGQVGKQLENLQQRAETFNREHEDIQIILLDFPAVPQEILQRYDQFLLSQDPGLDVLMVDVIWPGDLAEHLVDLQEYFSDDEINQHFPASIENNTVDGRLVGMPWFVDSGLLYYRTDLLEKYDRSVPETWGELEKTARYIQKQERSAGNDEFWGYIWQAGTGEGLTCVALEYIHSHGGGRIVNPDGIVDVANPRAINAVARAANWIGDITPPEALAFNGAEGPRQAWETGNYLFMRNWPYAYMLGQREDSPVAGRFDIGRLPAGADGRNAGTLGGWQLGVSRYSEHPEAAAEVVRYLTSYETQKVRALTQGDYPSIQALYTDEDLLESDNPMFSRLGDVFAATVPRPSTITAPDYNEFSRDFYTLVHRALAGDMSAAEALESVQLPQ